MTVAIKTSNYTENNRNVFLEVKRMMKVCIAIAGILSSLVLYCCIVIGKRADEHIKRLFERESGSEEGKK